MKYLKRGNDKRKQRNRMPPRQAAPPLPIQNITQQPQQLQQQQQSIPSANGTGQGTGNVTSTHSKSSKSKSQSQTTNVELEFTQRFLSLFTSFYENPSIDEILSFPQFKSLNPSGEIKQPARTPPFHSGVWDLRLRKALDARITNDQLTSDSLSEQVLQLRESLASESPDLNDVFIPQSTERPQIPRYLQNLKNDEKIGASCQRQRTKPSPINFQENSQIFSERLKRQKAICNERAKNRFNRVKEIEDEHRNFVKTLHKSKLPPEETEANISARAKFKVLQEQRERQLQEGRRTVSGMKSRSPARINDQEFD